MMLPRIFPQGRHAVALRGTIARIASARDGVTAIEFGILAPVFLLLMLGTFDLGQMVYGRAILNGAVQQAARSSSLETANTSEADQKVLDAVLPILPGATMNSERVSYYDFADIGRPEAWNDANNNDTCDNDESFTDENGNGTWDADVGEGGNGGAGDVVLYTVEISYKPLFPVPFMHNQEGQRTFTATAVKKNQPFADQDEYGSEAGTCS
jgi:hypothetical protein